MTVTRAYASQSPTELLAYFEFERRPVGANDVLIHINYCGVCHSDIHQARDEWGGSIYPMVPGHEIVGRVLQVGSDVKRFAIDDLVGVGCMVDSCRTCGSCQDHEEQYCEKHVALTYNSTEMDGKTPTLGGYASHIVVDQHFVLRVSSQLPLASVAPLLCAGITTYSPLKQFGAGPGKKVGIIGLGGLGHMAVKLAASMGADVTVFSTSPSKESDARRLGANHFVVTTDLNNLVGLTAQFDIILDVVSADHDPNIYLNLLTRGGVLAVIGAPIEALAVKASSLIRHKRRMVGSLIGGIQETQEMLDYCAEHGISSEVEVIPIQHINEAYERTLRGNVHYRFVIDMSSL